MSDSSVPDDPGEWCSEHFQYNCTDLSHGIVTVEDAFPVTDIFLGDVETNGPFTAEFTPPLDVDSSESSDNVAPSRLRDSEDITSGLEEASVSIGDGSCIVCGAPTFRPPGLTKAGHKKRTPKYCDLHDPKLRVSQERPIVGGVENQLKRVQEELADDIRLLGVMAGPLFPVTGVYVFENADPFTVALLKLCKNNQRALRILHRAASVAPIYEVAKDVAGTFYAVQVDMHKLDPHNTVSQRLGVQRAYNTVYPDTETNVVNNGSMQGPPRYAATQ